MLDRTDLDARLEDALATVGEPVLGLFGPESAVWEVARHTPVYLLSTPLGGFMDTAHPWVAHGVAEHSHLFADPHKRARLTYQLLMRIVFGDADTVRRTSRGLFAMHGRVEGVVPEAAGRFPAGSSYRANDQTALLFVHLVFFWTRLEMYRLVVGEFPSQDRDRYVAESARFAACFGIDEALLPHTHADFDALVRQLCETEVARTRAGLDTADFLLAQLPAPARPVFRGFLAETMPAPCADALDLPRGGKRTRAQQRLLLGGLRASRVLPAGLRYVPAWHEAQHRIDGVPVPAAARRFNKAVLGQETVLG